MAIVAAELPQELNGKVFEGKVREGKDLILSVIIGNMNTTIVYVYRMHPMSLLFTFMVYLHNIFDFN